MNKHLNLPTIQTSRQPNYYFPASKSKSKLHTDRSLIDFYNIQEPSESNISSQISNLQKSIDCPRFTYNKQRIKDACRLNIYNNLSAIFKQNKIKEMEEEKSVRVQNLISQMPEDYGRQIRKCRKVIIKTQAQDQERNMSMSNLVSQKQRKIQSLIKEKQNIHIAKVKLSEQVQTMKEYSMMMQEVGMDNGENRDWSEKQRCSFIVGKLSRMEDALVNQIYQLQNDISKNQQKISNMNLVNKNLKDVKCELVKRKLKLEKQLHKVQNDIEELSNVRVEDKNVGYTFVLIQYLKSLALKSKRGNISPIQKMKQIEDELEKLLGKIQKLKNSNQRIVDKIALGIAEKRQKEIEKNKDISPRNYIKNIRSQPVLYS